ncbi:Hsp70 family protein [Paractinoplanes globisporus]|uniref:Hsp70 family protein n=1 Tax=Paractinoplanes globisporus TaxID=113565 RepID=A0ABW6WLC7_9ACTN|nr:Hsp70 family protein [Actinoplanes globisporus]
MTEQSETSPSYHPVIGVDLGTTSCTMAVWDGVQLVVIPGPMRSVVTQNPAGQIVVGLAPEGDAQPVIAGIKRDLGSDERLRLRGRQYRPPEICAFLLIELKRQAEAFLGTPVHDAVITVSGSAAEPQRRAIREAAGLAQLNVRRLLDDPVAAAAALGPDDRERTYAIYDLGGGTFDTAIVRIGPEGVAVLGAAGDPRLGGDDFDEHMVGFALRQIRERHHVDLSQDENVRTRIRREAERRKRELSTAETTELELPLLTATVSASVPLSRRAFEAMIEPDVTKSLGHLTAALAAAEAEHGIGRGGVDQVVLAGASTRIPSVRARLAGYFGLGPGDIRADLDPGELNARGAGLIAREFEPAQTFEGTRPGLLGANLRLRAEMADPSPAAPDAEAAGPPDLLPVVPAETPADYRPVADASHRLLAAANHRTRPGLRAAYLAFVAAIQAAAPDDRLAELGEILVGEYAALG